MKLKKMSAFLLLILLLCCAARGNCADADYGRELFDFFLKKMNPEKAELRLQSMPSEKGEIPWAYLECVNANVRGMNISSLKMDCLEAVVTPPSQWKDVEYPLVKKMLACHAEGIFYESDVNAFLRDRLFGHDREWERISVSMKDGRIHAVGYYNADLKLMRVKVKLELSCRIVGRGTALWLEDVLLKVNDKKMSKGMVKATIDRLQPFLDMEKYNLPLNLTRIEMSDGVCRVATRIPPRPLEGALRYNYAPPSGSHDRDAAAPRD